MGILEFEHKFIVNPSLVPRFRLNQGHPRFRQFAPQGTRRFLDEYYDGGTSGTELARRGLWVRRRDGIWEAKQRRGGDFVRSIFHETRDVREIRRLIASHVRGVGAAQAGPERDFGLRCICRYRTDREMFLVDKRFSVVLDGTDFGHLVGEVEVMEMEMERQRHGSPGGLQGIEAFMRRYEWFFAVGGGARPKGKMTAYFERFGFPSECDTPALVSFTFWEDQGKGLRSRYDKRELSPSAYFNRNHDAG
ncbi:MAG: hypothetical protein M1818_006204 [Claussenomyces sp. TS43310]|nr:MAG: hypothetical protein M1818_006204 [Claussenomyces sp. TS43310]